MNPVAFVIFFIFRGVHLNKLSAGQTKSEAEQVNCSYQRPDTGRGGLKMESVFSLEQEAEVCALNVT